MKRSTKIVLTTVIGLGLVSAVTAKQFDGCEGGPGFAGQHRADWIAKRISHRLGLSETQEQALDKFKSSMLQQFDGWREHRLASPDIQSLLNNEFDQVKANQLLEQRLQEVRETAPTVIAGMADFYNQLDAEQQAQVREMIEDRMSHRRGPWQRGEGMSDNR